MKNYNNDNIKMDKTHLIKIGFFRSIKFWKLYKGAAFKLFLAPIWACLH